jgi:hypothetical protein
MSRNIWIGYDPLEHDAYKVAVDSLLEHYRGEDELDVRPLDMFGLTAQGFYRRPLEYRDGRPWDTLSGAPMSTTHANARFFIPRLQRGGLALFTDGDVLFRGDVEALFRLADPRYAVQVVKHWHVVGDLKTKKGGHVQLPYARKNWSSVMLWNLDHPAHKRLTDQLLNGAPGRELHAFCWLEDDEIGSLPASWNDLVGASPSLTDPNLVHYTLGLPNVAGYERSAFADEWRAALGRVRRLSSTGAA